MACFMLGQLFRNLHVMSRIGMSLIRIGLVSYLFECPESKALGEKGAGEFQAIPTVHARERECEIERDGCRVWENPLVHCKCVFPLRCRCTAPPSPRPARHTGRTD